ncbi:hypothetical protein VKT23_006041 [Stygiomarasmius scandens]|uniref:Uncharacterized protein n=1 Tax=Marasmiellus scandens TaxID=2682957 RepID=A0ABR1JTS8_9AGAR
MSEIDHSLDILIGGAGFSGIANLDVMFMSSTPPKIWVASGTWPNDFQKDTTFDTYVVSAYWDPNTADRWIVTAANGLVVKPRFLSFCMDFVSKTYIPSFKGLEIFKAICHHTAEWPQDCAEKARKGYEGFDITKKPTTDQYEAHSANNILGVIHLERDSMVAAQG